MNILTLCWLFIIFSFGGWIAEGIRAFFTTGKFVNKGFITSPFCPIYGAGVIVLYITLSPVSDNLPLLFLFSTLLLSAIIIIIGYITTKILGFKPWDFSKMRMHIGSYITFPYALWLGVLGAVVLYAIVPVLEIFIGHIPLIVSIVVIIAISILLVLDYITTFITIIRLKKKIAKLKNCAFDENEISEEKILNIKENYNLLFTNHLMRRRLASAFPELNNMAYILEFADKLSEVKYENMLEYTTVYIDKDEEPFAFGLCFTKLFFLFVTGSFVGTILETIWALFAEGHFEIRVGMVYGPFIPVYGLGACLLTLVLYKLYKLSDTLLFIISAVVGGGFEYLCSWFQEMVFGTISWDYSGTPFNLDGRTNLMYALIWGFLGLVWVRYLYPSISKLIEKMPKRAGSIITLSLVVFMIFNTLMSVTAVWRWRDRDNGIPPASNFELYLDKHFNDEKLQMLFPNMQNVNSNE